MYLNPSNAQVAARQRLEVRIVRQVVKDALKEGYTLEVFDGDDTIKGITTAKEAMKALINTDEDYLYLRKFDSNGAQVGKGWVRFVYGNDGWDVICDYTVNLESLLAEANALAQRLEARVTR